MLTVLAISNYRSLRKLIVPIRGLNVITGANVSVIGDNVAAGVPREEILRNYAALTDPDIDAALVYAAEFTREGTVDLPLEIKA
jgi:uncharacterized protein (DUF433 family)